MNREAAKIVLAACRPNGADANDPLVAEALALVQRDAELRAWFAAEQAADKAIAAKLKAVTAFAFGIHQAVPKPRERGQWKGALEMPPGRNHAPNIKDCRQGCGHKRAIVKVFLVSCQTKTRVADPICRRSPGWP